MTIHLMIQNLISHMKKFCDNLRHLLIVFSLYIQVGYNVERWIELSFLSLDINLKSFYTIQKIRYQYVSIYLSAYEERQTFSIINDHQHLVYLYHNTYTPSSRFYFKRIVEIFIRSILDLQWINRPNPIVQKVVHHFMVLHFVHL